MQKVRFKLYGLAAAVVFVYLLTLLFRTPLIPLHEVGRVESNQTLSGDWWFTVNKEQDTTAAAHHIVLPDIDFSQYNLVISAGSEIESLRFSRSSEFPFKLTHFGNVTFRDGLHPQTWFIYRMDKTELFRNE